MVAKDRDEYLAAGTREVELGRGWEIEPKGEDKHPRAEHELQKCIASFLRLKLILRGGEMYSRLNDG